MHLPWKHLVAWHWQTRETQTLKEITGAFHLDNRTHGNGIMSLKEMFFHDNCFEIESYSVHGKKTCCQFFFQFFWHVINRTIKTVSLDCHFPYDSTGWMGRGQQMQIRRFAKGALEGGGWLLPNKKRRWDKARRVGFIFTTFSRCQTLTSSTTFNQNFVQVVYVWQQKHDLRSSISKVDHCRRCLRRSDRPRRWLWKWVWKHGRTVMMSLFWNLKWYKINMFFRLVGW